MEKYKESELKLNEFSVPTHFHDMSVVNMEILNGSIIIRFSLAKYLDEFNILEDDDHFAILEVKYDGINISKIDLYGVINFRELTVLRLTDINDIIELNVNVSQFKGEITELKTDLENNSTLHSVEMNTGIIKFAHNDKHFYCDENVPDNEQVVCREHDSYLEAIVGAIYYDSGFFSVKKWFMNYLYNELKKNKVIKRVESNNFVEEKND